MSHKDYKKLCKRVALINKGAARYMRVKAIKLPKFSYDDVLMCCFVFENTPQGYGYWLDISIKLGE